MRSVVNRRIVEQGDDGGAGGETAMESALNAAWDEGIQRSREVLRGHPWVTVCAAQVVARLGGVAALQASGAFHQVSTLPTGSVWLYASQHLEDYQDETLRMVFRTVAPVLPLGEPRPYVGEHLGRMIYEDASAVT